MTSTLDPNPAALDERRDEVVLATVHRLLDRLQDQGVTEAGSVEAYDAELARCDRAIRRLEAHRLAVIAAADRARVADSSGLTDTSAWVARRTRANAAQASRDVRLATSLDSEGRDDPRPCRQALAAGDLSTEHARVIVQATEQLPANVGPTAVETVERDLIEKASRLSPEQLRRVARRALEVVEADSAVVDRHEDELLRTEEDAALARTRLTLHDNGDGTTSGHFTVPTLAAAVLRKVIQAMISPRRARLGAAAAQAGDPEQRRDWAHQAGLALVEVLEHLPTDHLHRKVAATVVVTIDHDRLQAAVGAAGLDIGDRISAGQLRRFACGAGILPAILNGQSVPLDLGRTHRFFSETHHVALATRQHTCAAEGCERPIAWCELHHRTPWSHGGTTNLADAVPLCGFHHRRIHDPNYHHHDGPDGVIFRLRA